MGKEIISDRQGISIMAMFIMGSTLVLGVGSDSKQDVWITILLAMVMALPILFVYARLLYLFPEKDLFDILTELFGGFIGKIIAIIFIWYAFHLGSLVIRNFSEFISVVSIPETPQYITVLCMGLLCIWAVKDGIELMGRWAEFVIPILISIILAVTLLSVSRMNMDNIRPILYYGFNPILSNAFLVFSFPFAETVAFTMVFNSLKSKTSSYRIFFISLLLGGAIVLIVSLRNILVLGADLNSSFYFPSYEVARLINVGEFLERLEIVITVVFLFAGFVKISVCLHAVSNGMTKILGLGNYKAIVAPIGFLMMLLSLIIYNNTMEMTEWAVKIYKYYAVPFQIILPILILIFAEIKTKAKAKAYQAI